MRALVLMVPGRLDTRTGGDGWDRADRFVRPTLDEGCGLAVAEALARVLGDEDLRARLAEGARRGRDEQSRRRQLKPREQGRYNASSWPA